MQGSQKAAQVWSHHTVYGSVSSEARILWSRNQRVEIGIISLTITFSDILREFFLPVPITLCSAGLEVTRKHNKCSSELKIKTLTNNSLTPTEWQINLRCSINVCQFELFNLRWLPSLKNDKKREPAKWRRGKGAC